MQFGVHVPNFGHYGDPRVLVDLARLAEDCGWDGFFLWDHVLVDAASPRRVVDPFTALAAIAARTERVRFGALVTPVARRRPWVLARQVATLDALSGGRVIFGAGLGNPRYEEFELFGEDGDDRRRAERLDEGLAILQGLWSGEPFTFAGTHYRIGEATFLPAAPSVPIWIGGNWPNPRPFRRAARFDGVMPEKVGGLPLTRDELPAALAYVRDHRPAERRERPFDVVIGGRTPGNDRAAAAAVIAAWSAAGATWWMERCEPRDELRYALDRIRAGPPETS